MWHYRVENGIIGYKGAIVVSIIDEGGVIVTSIIGEDFNTATRSQPVCQQR